jgi:hypothetical protein
VSCYAVRSSVVNGTASIHRPGPGHSIHSTVRSCTKHTGEEDDESRPVKTRHTQRTRGCPTSVKKFRMTKFPSNDDESSFDKSPPYVRSKIRHHVKISFVRASVSCCKSLSSCADAAVFARG